MNLKTILKHSSVAAFNLGCYNDNILKKNEGSTVVVLYPFVSRLSGNAEKIYLKLKGAKGNGDISNIRRANEAKAGEFIERLKYPKKNMQEHQKR